MKKILLQISIYTMKMSLYAILINGIFISLAFAGGAVAQHSLKDTYVQLRLHDAGLLSAFKTIENQTGLEFSYDHSILTNEYKINLIESNISVADALAEISKQTNLRFRRVNESIDVKTSAQELSPAVEEPANEIDVTGKVTDDNGEGLPGVNVIIKDTSLGTVTDAEGNYTLSVPDENTVLLFSFVGYIKEEVTVGSQTVINVSLMPNITSLQEIVVVGYGTQEKADLTGSVATIGEKELMENATAGVSQALQGKVAGVQVTANSGVPGGGIAVRVRGIGTVGDSNPLYVIDGFPTKTGINSINPSDIESITVLKDAAASAIYGARAANGVILVTTKTGKKGESKVSIDSYYGVQQAANRINALNSRDYVMITREAYRNSGLPDDIFWEDESNYGPGTQNPISTNWGDEVLRDAVIQNHQLTFSGGSEKTNYLLSVGYYGMEGIVTGSDFERLSARINAQTHISDKLRAGNNVTFASSDQNVVPDDNSWTSVLFGSLRALPTVPVRNDDGSWGGPEGPAEYVGDGGNPLRLAELAFDNRKRYRLLGTAYIEYEPIRNLTIKSNFGYDFDYFDNENFDPTFKEGATQVIQNSLNVSSGLSTTWVWENTANYSFELQEIHQFEVLLGIMSQDTRFKSLGANRQNFPNNEAYIRYLSAGTGTQTNQGTATEYALLSYLGRVNYSYRDKYLFQVNMRRDGSSRFGETNRFGTFPSASVGWRITEENFMSEVKFINNLKLRASYGQLGNQDIRNDYPWASNLNLFYYPLGDGHVPGYAPATPANPSVAWETTVQKNIGLDIGLFNNQLSITTDYFIKDTEDMLLRLPAPATTGYSTTAYLNVGEMRNKGIELAIDYSKSVNDWSYTVGGNLTAIRNEVINLGALDYIWSDQTYLGERWTRTEVGQPLSQFFGYIADGIFQTQEEVAAHGIQPLAKPGDIRFRDFNNDGVLDDKDRTYIGDPNPDFIYAAFAQVQYKNFDFNIRLQGSQGNDIYNGMIRQLESAAEPYNKWEHVLNRWTGPGTSNTVPRVTRNDINQNTRSSTRMIEDGSYMRIKNMQFGYTLPKEVLDRLKLQYLRLYVSADNLVTFTSYRGFDPEMFLTANSGTDIGVDRAKYPVARAMMLGVNLSF